MLKNVMWTPEMSYSMVSVPCLDLSGQLVVFGRSRCRVLSADVCDELLAIVDALPAHETLMTATLNGKLYHVDDTEREVSAATVGGTVPKARHVHSVGFERTPSTAREHPAVAATPVPYVFGKDCAAIKGSKGTVRPGSTAGLNPLQLLHIRSGHASKAVLLAGLKVNAFRGAQTTYQACAKLEIGPCDSCLRGSEQQGTITHSSRDFDALAPMQEVGMDPVRLSTPTIHREEYFNFGLCYGTRLAMGDPAKGEGNQVDVLKGIQRKWCTPFSHKIGTLHTDYASIFRSGEMQKYLLDQDIQHDMSSPYQHSHNQVESGCIKHVLNISRVLLMDAGLPPRFAGYAIKSAMQSWNTMLHPATATMTPLQRVTGLQPDVSGMRPFGALVYCFKTKEERNMASDPRWTEKADRGILLGSSEEVDGGYIVYMGHNQVKVRKQVVVIEAKVARLLPAYSDRFLITDPLTFEELEQQAMAPTLTTPPDHDDEGCQPEIGPTAVPADPTAAPTSTPVKPQRPPLVSTPTTHRHGHVTRGAANIGERALAVTEACNAAVDDWADPALEQAMVSTHGDMAVLPANPRGITEALRGLQSHEWRESLEKERDDTLATHSYVEVAEKPMRYVRAVMAMRVSRRTDGTLKYRSRLCPDGGSQVRGTDYNDSYSPTVRKATILQVLHVAAVQDWECEHLDVGNAYKEAMTDDRQPLHMKLSQAMLDLGFAKSPWVRLNVNYWGTKQAGQRWHATISFLVERFGLRRSGDDPCEFILTSPDGVLILVVLIYVDDILVTGSWREKITELTVYMRGQFAEVKGEVLAKFVGMQITRYRDRREIHVHLNEYAQEVVAKLVPDHVLGSSTPLYSTVDYRHQPPGTAEPIWKEVGMLRFMADSGWWDLMVATSLLASGGATPTVTHRRGMQKCLQYVKQHKADHALVLGGREPVELFGFTDASYTPEGDSRYLFGYALMLSPLAGAYAVRSKRSTTVSHSSAQSEIKAICEACKEVEPNRLQLAALGCPQLRPTRLYTDSQASVDLVSNVYQMHPKCRHFNRDINYIRQCMQLGLVELVFVGTDDNPADLLTKALGPTKHIRFTAMLLAGVGMLAVAALHVNGVSI
jgi:hypothetical protein